jgi:hypothetical protein
VLAHIYSVSSNTNIYFEIVNKSKLLFALKETFEFRHVIITHFNVIQCWQRVAWFITHIQQSRLWGGMSLLPRANLLSSADGRNNFNDVLMYQSRDHNSRKKTIIVIQLSFLHCTCLVLIGYVKMFNHLISVKKAVNTTL